MVSGEVVTIPQDTDRKIPCRNHPTKFMVDGDRVDQLDFGSIIGDSWPPRPTEMDRLDKIKKIISNNNK